MISTFVSFGGIPNRSRSVGSSFARAGFFFSLDGVGGGILPLEGILRSTCIIFFIIALA